MVLFPSQKVTVHFFVNFQPLTTVLIRVGMRSGFHLTRKPYDRPTTEGGS